MKDGEGKSEIDRQRDIETARRLEMENIFRCVTN